MALSNAHTVELKTEKELACMRRAGRVVAQVLSIVGREIIPGITTKRIDEIAYNAISSLGMKPAFLGYRGYPASACVSVNDELVHGIPRNDKFLAEGDIVSVDLGVFSDGFFGDAARTFAVGSISDESQRLIEVTRNALDKAIEVVAPGKRIGDIGWAIQRYVESFGFSVVRDYVGHGIGRQLHEDPPIPNFGVPGSGIRLRPGMVLAIEPMVNSGSFEVRTLEDGWTVVTVDGKRCAHYEHMVTVTEKGCEVLTLDIL